MFAPGTFRLRDTVTELDPPKNPLQQVRGTYGYDRAAPGSKTPSGGIDFIVLPYPPTSDSAVQVRTK